MVNNGHKEPVFLQRRSWIQNTGLSFGTIPLIQLLSEDQSAFANTSPTGAKRVKRAIFLFMNGGPSQLDTFDPKPALEKLDGKSYVGSQKVSSGNRVAGKLWKSDFRFSPQGESGIQISELYPNLGKLADDLCVVRSMQTDSSLHAPALLAVNSGSDATGAASLGTWIDYGLGDSKSNMPSFVVMLDQRGAPINGHANWSTGVLPSSTPLVTNSGKNPFIQTLGMPLRDGKHEQRLQKLLIDLNLSYESSTGTDGLILRRTKSYHDAWEMQKHVPGVLDVSRETKSTKSSYGLDSPTTREFGRKCLVARRLLEHGVRFVQVYSGGGSQEDTWDSHTGNNERHRKFAAETDQPIATFFKDLKERGLWDETLIIWGGEFGRTPTREATSNGRDHNPYGFTMLLAGGAIRPGQVVGATDEIGLEAVENPVSVHDLHATILHLFGLDHESLTFFQNGREHRLTGPQPARVVREVLT